MRRFGNVDKPPDMDQEALISYNKMHGNYRVLVEWDIAGLKWKSWKLIKQFDANKPKYNILLWATIISTNFNKPK